MISIIINIYLSIILLHGKDTTYVRHDPFVGPCVVDYYISPINNSAVIDSIIIVKDNVEVKYKNIIRTSSDFPRGALGPAFGKEVCPEDQYICNKYSAEALCVFFQSNNPEVVRISLIPKKASLQVRKALAELSDLLLGPKYVKTGESDYWSLSQSAKHRKQLISVLDARFDQADSIYFVELYSEKRIGERASYSVYSPDINISQSWQIDNGELRYGSAGISFHSIKHLKRIISFDIIDKRYSWYASCKDERYRIILVTKDNDGKYWVNYYIKTNYNRWAFWPIYTRRNPVSP